MALAEQGAATVILEKNCTAQAVLDEINRLLQDKQAYEAMHEAQLEIAVPDCAERMCGIMEDLISGKAHQ